MNEEHGISSTDGSLVTFDSAEKHELSTGQSIPDSLDNYSFDAEIRKISDNITCTIGITSETSFLQYCSETGEIKDDKGVLGKMEPIEQNTARSNAEILHNMSQKYCAQ